MRWLFILIGTIIVGSIAIIVGRFLWRKFEYDSLLAVAVVYFFECVFFSLVIIIMCLIGALKYA